MTLKHQYNGQGHHRIASLDVAGFLDRSGEWCGYQNIATFTYSGITYLAVTEYFAGGALVPDAIYQLSKTDFKSEVCHVEYP